MNISKEDKALIKAVGFEDVKRAISNLKTLNATPFGRRLNSLLSLIADTPDPDRTLNNAERILGKLGKEGISLLLGSKNYLIYLLKILSSSQLLSNILFRYPHHISWLFGDKALYKSKPLKDLIEELTVEVSGKNRFEEVSKILRLYKQREYLRIGAKDICGLADFEEITGELSDLAGACLEIAYRFSLKRLKEEEHGIPYYYLPDGSLREAEFVVIGMGKLGGRELNFSSDIDILYIYSSDNGATEGIQRNGKIIGKIDLHTFYIKLSRAITRLINDVTEDGFCFRVDLDLRPEGKNGDMANSMRSAEIYYESWGETWERSALIKARPVAGSMSLGDDFLKMIEPFVYRRYLDFTAVDEIKGMKERIDISLLKQKKGLMDVKLGKGGIREIEFFIQTIQIINGGKDPCVRDKNTLTAIERLTERGYISDEETTSLKRAYIFLRNVEHRLQILHGRQTHSLPDHGGYIKGIAKGLGFTENPYESFIEKLKRETEDVHRIYNRLFYEPTRRLEEDILKEIIYLSQDEDDTLERLSGYGFLEPEKALHNLRLLRDGPPFAHYSVKAKTLLHKIAPFLLTKIISSPAPDMALANMERFISTVGARRSLLSLLAENKGVMELMARLFGTSAFLSRFIIEHPELLDLFITHEMGGLLEGKDAMYKELSLMIDPISDYEERLDTLRRFRNIEILKVGIMDLLGETDPVKVSDHITDLADASLQKAYEMAKEEFTLKFGTPSYKDEDGNRRPASFSVLGLGKLGGRELIYGSDLDIIFIYSHSGETRGHGRTQKIRNISNHEFFARLAQRIISIISLITPEGFVFKIDTRLRPSGSSGPLVTSLEAFEKYHQEKAHIWERQALLKIRFSAGDRSFGEEVVSLAQQLIYCKPLLKEDEHEIHRLRMRMEKELGRETKDRIDIKLGKGGIVDIEFLVQLIQLKYGREKKGIRETNTLKVLDTLKEERLIPGKDYQILKKAYSFYRFIENRLRIVEDRANCEIILSDTTGGIERLSRELGFKEVNSLVEKYLKQSKKIRELYNSYLTLPG